VTAMFASRFREAAGRALLLPKHNPNRRAALWQQRKRAADLLHAAARFGSFPIVLETYRECLRDVFDMPALVRVLQEIETGQLRVVTVDSLVPSPFASALLFSYVANFMYEGDAPAAERRAQALTVDPVQLRQLLGEVELRELLDPDALADLERSLQRLDDDRLARNADELHDLLLRLGDLSAREIGLRCKAEDGGAVLIETLLRAARIVAITVAGEERYIAVEDAARYRDALGARLPDGLPPALLEPEPDALQRLISRYARTHGPFVPADIAGRFGCGAGPVLTCLRALADEGRLVQGELRPGGSGIDWCDADVLRALRGRSLARLRREVEPVEQDALARLYLRWQGIRHSETPRADHIRPAGPSPLLDVVAQLQGAAIPASALEAEVLRARTENYDPRDLDLALASGELIWVGVEPINPRDGKVRLYLAESAPLLADRASAGAIDGPLHGRIRAFFETHGAAFFPTLMQGIGGGFQPDIVSALWDLVWSGEVTNDTFQAVREYMRGPSDRRGREIAARRVPHSMRYGPRLMSGAAGRPAPPEAGGRWSLVSRLLGAPSAGAARIAALALSLVERYGVLTREAVHAEGIDGGFSAVYPALKAMEEAGRLRRGYFVAGLGATQFALPGAADLLRELRTPPAEPETFTIDACDPANPYGAALSWPERPEGRRPMRTPGAFVVLVDGRLGCWIARTQQSILTFPEAAQEGDTQRHLDATARAIAHEVACGTRRGFLVEEVDGRPAADTAFAASLVRAGFSPSARGYLLRR